MPKRHNPEEEREYKYLDFEALQKEELEPCYDSVDVVLENALLDILQLAEANDMSDEVVDRVIRKIQDDRAAKVRRKFRLHVVADDDKAENE